MAVRGNKLQKGKGRRNRTSVGKQGSVNYSGKPTYEGCVSAYIPAGSRRYVETRWQITSAAESGGMRTVNHAMSGRVSGKRACVVSVQETTRTNANQHKAKCAYPRRR